jgi:hypothetical protein
MSLLGLTLLLGCLSTAVVVLLCGRTATPALFYWLGWSLAVLGAQSVGGDAILPPLTERTGELVLPLHIGAAIGFAAGALLFRFHTEVFGERPAETQDWRLHMAPALVLGVFAAHALTSLIGVHYRASEMGGYLALLDISAVRASFLERVYLRETLPPMVRLTAHLGVLLSLVPFLLALQDALAGRFRWQRVALWWLLAMPGGWATGGRGWIIAAPVTYGATYVIVAGLGATARVLRPHLPVIVGGFVGVMLLFSSIQLARVDATTAQVFDVQDKTRWHDHVPVVKPVLYYFGIPVLAIPEYSDFVLSRPVTKGGLTAPFFAAQLGRFGLTGQSADYLYSLEGRISVMLGPDPLLGHTHATAVPRFLGDFGRMLYGPAFALLSCIVQFLFLQWRDRGIVRRLIAVNLALYGGLWVAQDFMLFSATAVLPVLLLGVLMLLDHGLRDSALTPRRVLSLEPVSQPPVPPRAAAGLGLT